MNLTFGYTDYLYLSCTPSAEPCEQVPYKDPEKAKYECKVFISQLKRQFPEQTNQGLVGFKITLNPHDFGSYHDVIVMFMEDNEESVNAAYHIESNMPEYWDEQAKEQLNKYVSK